MEKKLLLKLYTLVPNRFKRTILGRIVKMEGGSMYSTTLRQIYQDKYRISIGYGTYGGCFNLKNNLPPDVRFGNYCSIAQNIRIFRANHPKGAFTTHPLLYNPVAGYVKKDMLDRPSLDIGHDVWIGEWAVILPKVTRIGNGAIIGAGSVVTKNVEPYTIVGGNPAKVLGKRFDDEIIQGLEDRQWWNMERDQLINNIPILEEIIGKAGESV